MAAVLLVRLVVDLYVPPQAQALRHVRRVGQWPLVLPEEPSAPLLAVSLGMRWAMRCAQMNLMTLSSAINDTKRSLRHAEDWGARKGQAESRKEAQRGAMVRLKKD